MNTYLIPAMIFFLAPVALAQNTAFQSKTSPIPKSIQKVIKRYTWHQGCPVPLHDLTYIQLRYWGFDDQPHTGALIVNKELASEVVNIFKALYRQHYPIERMELMDAFKGDDNAAMDANNTSSFNCREVTGRPGEFSQHSYGRAIDINTLINPYVNGKKILPANGAAYADRHKPAPGKIVKGDFVYQEFVKRGWDWAGNWFDVQDYQHFEKRANGEKRNPYGYAKPNKRKM